jgi:hypothetical protein
MMPSEVAYGYRDPSIEPNRQGLDLSLITTIDVSRREKELLGPLIDNHHRRQPKGKRVTSYKLKSTAQSLSN